MISTMQARTCCVCNKILKGPVQPFTPHSSLSSELSNNFHRAPHDQPGHLLPDRQHLVDQPERLVRHHHMITEVPGLPAQSSSTPVASRPRTVL